MNHGYIIFYEVKTLAHRQHSKSVLLFVLLYPLLAGNISEEKSVLSNLTEINETGPNLVSIKNSWYL